MSTRMHSMRTQSLFITLLAIIWVAEGRLIYRTPTELGRTTREADIVPEHLKNTTDLIESMGHIAERYELVTEDGYIVTMHRMVPPAQLDPDRVVLLLHGFGGASDNWFLNDNDSLPLMLSALGYDVWLPNMRGNSYSNKHTKYKKGANDPRYWNTSFHEQGYYDMPLFMDTVVNMTGAKQVYLVGHSLGSTLSFILLSLRPEYNDKVKLLICYAPTLYLRHMGNSLAQAAFHNVHYSIADALMRDLGLWWFLPVQNVKQKETRLAMCGFVPPIICLKLLEKMMGMELGFPEPALPKLIAHYPNGMSLMSAIHYQQIAQTNRFAQYDFGKEENLLKYNSTKPPKYPLNNIRAPTALFYSTSDALISNKDRKRVQKELPNLVRSYEITAKKFTHFNFALGEKTRKLVFDPTIELMESFARNDNKNKLNMDKIL